MSRRVPRRLLLLWPALAFTLPLCHAMEIKNLSPAKKEDSSKASKFSFAKGAELTKDQQETVTELAAKCGIKKVAEMSTYRLYPSPFRGITVKGMETINGRKVTAQVLRVEFSKWCPTERRPQKDDIQIGNFWASKPFVREEIILRVDGKEYRTSVIDGLSPEECDHLLGQLLAGKYSVIDSVRGETLQQIDWSKPQFFRKSSEMISVSFLHQGGEGSGFFDLQIDNSNRSDPTIKQVLQAVP